MATHILKTVDPYFMQVWKGNKNFECRLDDGRDYKTDDILYLRRCILDDVGSLKYNGQVIIARVGYILTSEDFQGLMPKYCIMQLTETFCIEAWQNFHETIRQ